MNRLLLSLSILFGVIAHISACSGPGAPAAIERSIEVGLYYAYSSIGLGLLATLLQLKYGSKTGRFLIIVIIVLTLVHPGFWMSARGGDCGMVRNICSKGATYLIIFSLFLTTILAYRKQQQTSS